MLNRLSVWYIGSRNNVKAWIGISLFSITIGRWVKVSRDDCGGGRVSMNLTANVALALCSSVKTSCLYTDSSGKCMGCFLTQFDEDGKMEVVIAFGSIPLTPTQIKYHITHRFHLITRTFPCLFMRASISLEDGS